MEFNKDTYQEALDYLYSFVDYSLTRNFRFSPDKFDLGRMVEFLELLGNPHHAYPVIHVAGTKGKGSTSAMIASCLIAAGYNVGLYTSPHLQEYTERIQINRQPITKEELVELVNFVKPYVNQVKELTTFEITTALGFLYYARRKVDVAVIEVGLGGRLDASNVVDPMMSVITSLSMDHMSVLGDTLAKIAFEKAGIVKAGRPVVLALQAEEAQIVLQQVSSERGSPITQVGKDYLFTARNHDLDGQTFKVWPVGAPAQALQLQTPLLGLHQVENGATAYTALQLARKAGLSISDQAILRGFADVRWPGRFEILSRQPLLVVDSAHNRDSARRLSQALEDYFPGKKAILIFGSSDDKDIDGMFADLLGRVDQMIVTQSFHPRAADPARLVELAAQHGISATAVVPVEAALEAGLARVTPESIVLAAGSLFIAAAVREVWQKNALARAASSNRKSITVKPENEVGSL
jgi:dihydrofolate synthase / folylpolyglutamate synthase